MTAIAQTEQQSVLTDEILIRCHERSAGYDQDNAFFTEDFQELRDAGYLTLPIPQELGGYGLNLAEVAREQRRLAYYAAPTALAINMHLYWLGVAADLTAMDPRGGEPRPGLRGGTCGERQRHSAAPVHDVGRARRRRLPLHGPQLRDAQQAHDVSRSPLVHPSSHVAAARNCREHRNTAGA